MHDTIHRLLFTLESELNQIEIAQFSGLTLRTLESAIPSLKQLLDDTSIERIDNVTDKLMDLADRQQDINAALERSMPSAAPVDEDDLEAELESLIAASNPTPTKTADRSSSSIVDSLPNVPSDTSSTTQLAEGMESMSLKEHSKTKEAI